MGRGKHEAGTNFSSPRRTGVDPRVISELAQALEKRFFELVGDRGATDQPALGALVGLYGTQDASEILDRYVDPFIRARRSDLRRLYSAYADDPRRPELLTNPLSILILERMTNDRFRLQQAWPPGEPPSAYERIAAIWGVPSPFSAT